MLARQLVEPWTARLRAAAPERSVVVRVAPPDPALCVCIEVLQSEKELVPPAGW